MDMIENRPALAFKCKVCRLVLFTGDDVVDSHSDKYNFQRSVTLCEDQFLWFLREDKLPSWVTLAVKQGGWTKGRIACPKCETRIGSFDYIGGSKCACDQHILPPVHISRSKVDCSCLKVIGHDAKDDLEIQQNSLNSFNEPVPPADNPSAPMTNCH